MECSREEQIQRFGVDCGDGIFFRGGQWVPGGEYIQKLVVRNVSTKTQKFKYKLPKTKFFSMAFPEAITLSPGMSATIDVVFRPIQLEEYDDDILIMIHSVKAGQAGALSRFYIPVKARLAHLNLEAAAGVDLGFCPTAELAEKSFTLTNTGQLPATFSWDVSPPFTLTPSSGHLEEGERIDIVVGICPADASVLVSKAICNYASAVTPEGDDGNNGLMETALADDVAEPHSLTTNLSAIGKYAHIEVSASLFDFNDVLIGSEGTDRMPTEQEFVISNPSLVPASWKIASTIDEEREGTGEVFNFSQLAGCIEPEGEVHVKVRFTPRSGGCFSCDSFDVVTPGGNRRRITCKGFALGPNITVGKAEDAPSKTAPTSINFGDVPVGQSVRRALVIKNSSEHLAHYSFAADGGGTFAFDEVTGTVAGLLSKVVNIEFTPTESGNFYRRVTLLIQHQMPLFVDLLATAYTPKLRPEPLLQVHVDAQRHRARDGMAALSMPEMDAMIEAGQTLMHFVRANKTSVGTALEKRLNDDPQITRSGETRRSRVLVAAEFFEPATSTAGAQPVTLDREVIDFGTSSLRGVPTQLLHVTNRANAKVNCLWRIPSDAGLDGADGHDHFEVSPRSADVMPGETVEFRVAFKPTHANSYYLQELEGYVTFKAARNFRLVNGRTLAAPWCLPLRVSGHTFHAGHEQFLPQVSLSEPGGFVSFPACHIGDAVYQSVALHNTGSTPAMFRFDDDPSGVFTVKPSGGLLQKHSFQVVCVRFKPNRVHRFNTQLECVLNNDQAHSMHVRLVGLGCEPCIAFDTDGVGDGANHGSDTASVYFKPTACGLVSRRKVHLHNSSACPAMFKCEIPPRLRGVISLTPRVGRLRGHEDVDVEVAFAPKAEKQYAERLPFIVRAIASADGLLSTTPPTTQDMVVRVVGLGTCAAVTLHPPSLDFATTLVKKEIGRDLTLVNSSDSALLFRLRALPLGQLPGVTSGGDFSAREHDVMRRRMLTSRGAFSTDTEVDADNPAEDALSFDTPAGILPARSRKKVKVAFLPARAGGFSFAIFCETIAAGAYGGAVRTTPVDECFELAAAADDGDGAGTQPEPLVVRAVAKSAFPTLMVYDIRSAQLSTERLWLKQDISELNTALAKPLTPAEVEFNADTAPDYSWLQQYDVLFEEAPAGSSAQSITFLLRNPGQLGVDFDVRFPNESEVELERWADKGEPTEEEVRINWIMDNELFEVSPKAGHVAGGETVTFTLSYNYRTAGKHDLPLVLRIAKGKQMRLRLRGTSLQPAQPTLVLPSASLSLKPMPIGLALDDAPIQAVQLRNPGGAELAYTVDVEPLRALVAESYDFDVLACLNPEGHIPPGGAVDLEWRFCPLQAREYAVPLSVSFRGGYTGGDFEGTSEARLSARGFHPHAPEHVRRASMYGEEEIVEGQLMKPIVEAPRQQLLVSAGQLLGLSLDRVDLGALPLGSVSCRLVTVRNLSSSTRITFEWDDTHPFLREGLVRLHPPSGMLEPGAHAVCKLTLNAVGVPRVLDDDIACRVEEVAPPPEPQTRRLSSRARMSSAGSTVLDPAKEIHNIGRKQHTSVVEATTKSRALKVLPKVPYMAGAEDSLTTAAPSSAAGRSVGGTAGTAQASAMAGSSRAGGFGGGLSTAGSQSTLGGGGIGSRAGTGGGLARGGGGRRPMASSVTIDEALGAVPPEVARLRIKAEVQEFESYQRQRRDQASGKSEPQKEYWMPSAPEAERAAGGALMDAAMAERRGLLQDVMGFLVCDVVGSEDVVAAMNALPAEQDAEVPYFRNFAQYGRRADAPPPEAPRPTDSAEAAAAEEQEREREDERERERKRIAVLGNAECRNVLGRVLENTVFNLLEEASHGESNITVVPKQYVVLNNNDNAAADGDASVYE